MGNGHHFLIFYSQEHIFLIQIPVIQIEHFEHKTKSFELLFLSIPHISDHEFFYQQTSSPIRPAEYCRTDSSIGIFTILILNTLSKICKGNFK
ncbi:hypothetical protein D3C75_491480 [compost metagenome]